jgi:Ca-activated chloride channel family protein
MTFDPDDPRLTAFALGELEGPEREAVETLVERDAQARRFVEETRVLARVLGEQLRGEAPGVGLTDAQREAIERAAGRKLSAPSVLPFLPSGGRWLRHALAAAAMLAVGVGSYLTWQVKYGSPPREAMDQTKVAATPAPRGEASARDLDAAPLPAPAAPGEAPPIPESLALRFDAPRSAPAESAPTATPGETFALGRDSLAPGGVELLAEAHENRPAFEAGLPADRDLARGMPAAEPDAAAGATPLAGSGGGAPAAAMSAPAPEPRADGIGGGRDLALGREGLTDFRGAASETLARRSPSDPSGPVSPRGLARPSPEAERPAVAAAAPPAAVAPKLRTLEARQTREEKALTDSFATTPARPLALGAEQYAPIVENDFVPVTPASTLATFSTDVDTGSYANVRRMLMQNTWPRRDAVRVEELINYFWYAYPEPEGEAPFSVACELTEAPWNKDNWLLRVGLKGRSIRFEDRKPTNLVFLVDVSGSMEPANKLPLVKAGLRMLAEQLGEQDTISIVTYAGEERLALPPTNGLSRAEIVSAIDQLQSGGSTNGQAGINLAYTLAAERFRAGGVNRVILATDGDFNVGVQSVDELVRLAEQKAKSGVFLSVLGVGEANLKDQTLEQIADKGNGNYSYLDSLLEARKVLVEQAGGTLVTIAKDVKVQVDLNPAKIGAYRLIGYENRSLRAEDFRDDAKDAGEIGSGHTVTALLELVPAEAPQALALKQKLGDSKYSKAEVVEQAKRGDEFLNVALRYKTPEGDTSQELRVAVNGPPVKFGEASDDTRFASAVALFGMILRDSAHKGTGTLDAVLEIASSALGADPGGYRKQFLELVRRAQSLRAPLAAPVP